MAKSKLNRILDYINNDPELLAIYETGFIGQEEELLPESENFIPCYGTQSFQRGGYTYHHEIVSIKGGGARYTGRVF